MISSKDEFKFFSFGCRHFVRCVNMTFIILPPSTGLHSSIFWLRPITHRKKSNQITTSFEPSLRSGEGEEIWKYKSIKVCKVWKYESMKIKEKNHLLSFGQLLRKQGRKLIKSTLCRLAPICGWMDIEDIEGADKGKWKKRWGIL